MRSLIMSSMLQTKRNHINEEAVVTFNQVLFNKQKELLLNNINVTNTNPDKTDLLQLSLVDLKENAYGNIRNIYKFTGITDEQIAQTTKINSDGSLNTIIPYAVAKADNLKIGSKFSVKTNGRINTTITLNVVGINRLETFKVDTR
jgi:hypothetical protein